MRQDKGMPCLYVSRTPERTVYPCKPTQNLHSPLQPSAFNLQPSLKAAQSLKLPNRKKSCSGAKRWRLLRVKVQLIGKSCSVAQFFFLYLSYFLNLAPVIHEKVIPFERSRPAVFRLVPHLLPGLRPERNS